MGEPPGRRGTYTDVLAAPDHLVAEMLAGDLVLSRRPRLRHAIARDGVLESLRPVFGRGEGGGHGPGGWWIVCDPEVHVDDDVVVPDLAGWRRARLPVVPDVAFVELAPDWVCEVLSPATARIDRIRKRATYARAGVGHLWMVDPGLGTLEAYRNHMGAWLEVGAWEGSVDVRAAPFDAVTLWTGRWWGQDEPEGAGWPPR